MFIKFNGSEIINANAVSEVALRKVNDKYSIQLFRVDGSFLTSNQYSDPEMAKNIFGRIMNELNAVDIHA